MCCSRSVDLDHATVTIRGADHYERFLSRCLAARSTRLDASLPGFHNQRSLFAIPHIDGLPDVIIRLAERFLGACGVEAGDLSKAAAGDAPAIAKLVTRLYSQSRDEGVRTRCLDLIDEMERLNFVGIEWELKEHDR